MSEKSGRPVSHLDLRWAIPKGDIERLHTSTVLYIERGTSSRRKNGSVSIGTTTTFVLPFLPLFLLSLNCLREARKQLRLYSLYTLNHQTISLKISHTPEISPILQHGPDSKLTLSFNECLSDVVPKRGAFEVSLYIYSRKDLHTWCPDPSIEKVNSIQRGLNGSCPGPRSRALGESLCVNHHLL